MYNRLIVFSGNIGYGVSGGSDATMHLTSYLQKYMEVAFVCHRVFDMKNRNNVITLVKNQAELQNFLSYCDDGKTLFYGDFRDAIALAEMKLPFIFTYHDNWPGLSILPSITDQEKNTTIADYAHIFRSALHVFVVSEYSQVFVEKHTNRQSLVRNGFTPRAAIQANTSSKKIAMIGNIDKRKYGLLPSLLLELRLRNISFMFDIYGNDSDSLLCKILSEFEEVSIKGFRSEIDLAPYGMLLSVSFMENLPISMVEAVAVGLPIVAYDVGGISEIVSQDAGMLIPPYDHMMLADTLEMFHLTQWPKTHKSLSEVYNWEKAADSMFIVINRDYELGHRDEDLKSNKISPFTD